MMTLKRHHDEVLKLASLLVHTFEVI
jgi:hypothetical protein